MKTFIKKYWLILTIFLFIDAFFIVTCTIPTDKELTRPGGLNEVLSLISVDGATKLEGSINTIYVKSYDNPTIMQTILVGLNNADDVSVSNPNYALSFQESQLSGLQLESLDYNDSDNIIYESEIIREDINNTGIQYVKKI